MKNIVLFGAPGVGKGTQASLLTEKYHLVHLSTGEMLRAEVAASTSLGMRVKETMNRGDLVGDDIVLSLIDKSLSNVFKSVEPDEWDRDRIEKAKSEGRDVRERKIPSIIYDGFPRTVEQAQMLEFIFRRRGLKLDCVISISVSRDELVRRIRERAAISNRADDNEEVIKHRLEEYDRKTKPVLDYYDLSGRLITVDGSGGISQTNTRLCGIMEKVLQL